MIRTKATLLALCVDATAKEPKGSSVDMETKITRQLEARLGLLSGTTQSMITAFDRRRGILRRRETVHVLCRVREIEDLGRGKGLRVVFRLSVH